MFSNHIVTLIVCMNLSLLIESKERNDFMFSNFECEANDKYVKIHLCRLAALRGQVPDLRVKANILIKINSAQVLLQMYRKYNYYQKFPIQFKVDGCRAIAGKRVNVFVGLVRDYVLNQSNLSRTCPIYPVTNYVEFSTEHKPVNFSKLLPSIFPKGLFSDDLNVVLMELEIYLNAPVLV